MFPGFDGGAEWGGSAFDPDTDILYVNSNEVPWIMTMLPTETASPKNVSEVPEATSVSMGREAYRSHCMACHGPDRQGGGDYPALVDVETRYSPSDLVDLIRNGRRMMPGFSHLPERQRKAIVNYLIDEEHFAVDPDSTSRTVDDSPSDTPPYVMAGYEKFRAPDGSPAVSPPWGTLNAINLRTGEYVWRTPLGSYPDLEAAADSQTGAENYGGSVVTAGGLVFIAATPDEKIRAFDNRTGETLWSADLPAAGFATPSIYEVNGRQYVVVACGGGKLGAPSGDAYVAFALPEQ